MSKEEVLIRRFALMLILFVGTAPARAQEPPRIEHVEVYPNPFSPNGDGVRDVLSFKYTLSDTAHWVTAAVKDIPGAGVATLLNEVPQSAGTYTLHWNGLRTSGAQAPDGTYQVQVTAANEWGQREAWSPAFDLDTTPPVARITEIWPNPYAADLPASPDSLRVSLTVAESQPQDHISVSVGPKEDATTDTLSVIPSFTGDGDYSCYWKDAGGEDGVYRIEVLMEDVAVNRTVEEAFFVLDKSAPEVEVYRPSGSGVFRELPDSILGRAYDDAGTASVEIAFDGGAFARIAGASGSDTVYWASPLRDSIPEEGEHLVKLRATDLLGHVGAEGEPTGFYSFSVTLDSQPPPPPSIDPLPSVVRSPRLQVTGMADEADSVALYLNSFEAPSIKLNVTNNGTFSGIVTLSPGSNGIAASSVDEAGNQSSLSPIVDVEYREEFGLFFNERFRPGDAFEISLGQPAREVTLALYSTSGRMVRILRGNGSLSTYTLIWDGYDSSGASLNSGVYLCRVKAELEDGTNLTQKKLVALVR